MVCGGVSTRCLIDAGRLIAVRDMKRVVTTQRKGDADTPSSYWVTRPVQERLAMVEQLRAEFHGWTDESQPQVAGSIPAGGASVFRGFPLKTAVSLDFSQSRKVHVSPAMFGILRVSHGADV